MAPLQTKTSCPKCQGRITIITALLATPYRFTCPQCRSRLKIAAPGLWLWVVGAVLLGAVLAGGFLYVLTLGNKTYFVLYLAASLVLALLAEIITAMVFFSKGEIRAKDQ